MCLYILHGPIVTVSDLHVLSPSPSCRSWFPGQTGSPCRPTSAPAPACLPPWWRWTAKSTRTSIMTGASSLVPKPNPGVSTPSGQPSAHLDVAVVRRGLVELLSQLGRELRVPEGALGLHHHFVTILADDDRRLGDVAHLSGGKANTCQAERCRTCNWCTNSKSIFVMYLFVYFAISWGGK